MTNKEAIKYLQQLYPNGGHCWLDEQRIEAIGMAVNALQEEPVSDGLDEAASNYSEEHRIALMDYETGEIEMNKSLDILNAFKAGAEWGKNQAMAEIQAQSMALAHGCPKEEPISEDLDINVIKEELDKAIRIYKPNGDFGWGTLYNIACHFANWQKQQMMKNAVEGEVTKISPNDHLRVVSDVLPLKDDSEWGTRVKLIIIKED